MSQVTDWSYETALAADPISASKARDFVCLHLIEHQLLYLVADVRLVVSELATNAMAHAQTPFVLTLSKTDETVLLAIQDGSPSVPVRAIPGIMDMGGRGLVLVEMLSHSWGVRSHGGGLKSVWASFLTRTRQLEPVSDPVSG